jgi:hypothetical protein
MRTRIRDFVSGAAFAIVLAQAEVHAPQRGMVVDMPLVVVEGVPPAPRFERAARAPTIPSRTSVPVRRDFRERVVASAGAL